MDVGIVSYGAYVPRYRISPKEIGRIWGVDGEAMGKGLFIHKKSVPSPDEDVITIATEAARNMMSRTDVNAGEIGAIYVGSESHPYAVKPTGTVVAEAIGATPDLTVADFEFACKAGTAGIQACMGLVGSGMVRYGVAIGADTSQGAPGDALEYSASAGGAAYLIGSENIIAKINKTLSFTTDTPDFWRRESQPYPSHGGRFTGEPAYFKHIGAAAERMFKAMDSKPSDYTYAVFPPSPTASSPRGSLKNSDSPMSRSNKACLTPFIGNTYSGAVPIGLASVLDVAKPGDRIFVVAYGSGAGSDAFDITVTENISKLRREAAPTVAKLIENTVDLDYGTYAKFKGKIAMSKE